MFVSIEQLSKKLDGIETVQEAFHFSLRQQRHRLGRHTPIPDARKSLFNRESQRPVAPALQFSLHETDTYKIQARPLHSPMDSN